MLSRQNDQVVLPLRIIVSCRYVVETFSAEMPNQADRRVVEKVLWGDTKGKESGKQ